MAFVKETFVNKAVYVKRVRKHRYIKPFALLLAAVLLCGTTGCSKNEERNSDPESPAVVSDSAISNGSFDWDKALSEFYIDGIKMEYPFSESSLGEDFTFDDKTYDEATDLLIITVDHKENNAGLWLFKAEYIGISPETYNYECVPSAIYSVYNPEIQGIKEGTLMDSVYALWGKPNEIKDNPRETDYDSAVYYGKEDVQKIYVRYDNTTNKVESIQIDFVNMKG